LRPTEVAGPGFRTFGTMKYTIAIHGGAGTILRSTMTPEKELAYRRALEDALLAGETILSSNGSAIDAVEKAVQVLEDNILFNAGRGAVFTHGGKNEMDASIMDGRLRKAGAVTCVEGVKNPVTLARAVMDQSEHVFMSGTGAEEFARKMNIAFESHEYFFSQDRYDQLLRAREAGRIILDHTNVDDRKFGTVGAVALDNEGNLAAATSTGGMTNKRYGRIGDSPIIGAGTYASNETCAVSCTGHGEYFIRAVVAYDISCLMEYRGYSLKKACEEVVMNKLKNMGGEGGLVACDSKGNVEMVFNSEGMYRAMKRGNEGSVIGIYRD
jgi:L-asparaginase / beta-aspartyl-peptidase